VLAPPWAMKKTTAPTPPDKLTDRQTAPPAPALAPHTKRPTPALVNADSFERSLRLVISFGALKRKQFVDALEERLAPPLKKVRGRCGGWRLAAGCDSEPHLYTTPRILLPLSPREENNLLTLSTRSPPNPPRPTPARARPARGT